MRLRCGETINRAVLSVLMDDGGAWTNVEIADWLNMDGRRIKNALDRLYRNGLVRRNRAVDGSVCYVALAVPR